MPSRYSQLLALLEEAKEKGYTKKDASPYIEEHLDLQNVLQRSSKNWDGG